MSRKKFSIFVGPALLILFTVAPESFGLRPGVRCSRPGVRARGEASVPRPKGSVKSLKELMSRLRAGGAKVGRAGRISQPFFSVRGQAITVGGEQVQVFVYANAASAEGEAKNVGGTGSSVGTSMVSWVAPPHFYKSGRVIVLYVGSNAGVTKALEDVLGPQFAGQ